MKRILIPLLFLTSVLAYSQELTINSILNNRHFYNDGKMRVIIYYIPFSISTRWSLSIEDVKKAYDIKIETRRGVYEFIKSIRNKKLQIVNNNDYGNMRAVIEFYYDDEMIFFYALDMAYIVINENYLQYDRQFYEFITLYLPKIYEYDHEWFLK